MTVRGDKLSAKKVPLPELQLQYRPQTRLGAYAPYDIALWPSGLQAPPPKNTIHPCHVPQRHEFSFRPKVVKNPKARPASACNKGIGVASTMPATGSLSTLTT